MNLAARVESSTISGQILISEHTYDAVRDKLRCSANLRLKVKWINPTIMIYEVADSG